MNNQSYALWLVLVLGLSASFAQHQQAKNQVFIVYIGEHSGEKTINEIEDNHHSYLFSVKGSKEAAKASLIYSYKNVINGFSALLTPDEANKLSKMEGVVSVFPSHARKHRLQTTRSWDFVSLLEGGGDQANDQYEELLQKSNYGQDVIVGVVDSGIWPESQSFSDEGMEPIPKSWKGICQTGVAFNKSHCNRKIIGARYYLKNYEAAVGPLDNREDYRSPRDKNSHGTHVASTVGGRRVANVSGLGGFAYGTASGGAPLVRLAIYKVCWPIPGQSKSDGNTCLDGDMLAAIDDAIADGVHVLSISIGASQGVPPYSEDGIAIGALHAVKRNIVVVCSAGNTPTGPTPSTVVNVAPWILTVAASSIDRDFPSAVVLGNQKKIAGQTVTPFKPRKMHRIVFAQNVEVPGTASNITGLCLPGTLSRKLVRGKIVVCLGLDVKSPLEVKRAGGVGVIKIIPLPGSDPILKPQVLSSIAVRLNDAASILNYLRDSKNPMAKLLPGKTVLGSIPAPIMAIFTSLGPNALEPNIIKPDITAPGVNILAAWSEAVSPTQLAADHRVVKYSFDSGTSMACPHVSAAVALLKAIHPDWSSAAIRSALMTTALLTNNMGKPITDAAGKIATPFHYGSGHFQPAKAADPGLVYDASYLDYLLFLCNTGYDLDSSFLCPHTGSPSPSNLNYPSLAIAELKGTETVIRTVTNVGASKSVYSLSFEAPTGFDIEISPTVLKFSRVGEKINFFVTVNLESGSQRKLKRGEFSFGWYMWSDGIHMVRSPIAVSSA